MRVARLALVLALLLALVVFSDRVLGDKFPASPQQGFEERPEDKKLEILAVAIPLSPLHSVAAISQELCLRGHNVTVASLGEEGIRKTRKYTPRCNVNYLSLGAAPMTGDQISETVDTALHSKDTSVVQKLGTFASVASGFLAALHPAVRRALEEGLVKPDFALLSIGSGQVAALLQEHGIDYAVNIPTNLMPPASEHVAFWVPPAFMDLGIDNMSFLQRLFVISLNSALYFGRRMASHLKLIPPAAADMDPSTTTGRLVLVNSVPGLDYPQFLPPLVQYTGPIIDVNKMEALPPEVEAWLDSVPEGKPVVYISYGTVFFVPADQLQNAIQTLAGDEVYVLWALPKANQKSLPPTLPATIFVHHWISTPRALSHPKVKAFVSHCGGNSVSESMAIGKPVVGYPQAGDQPGNCQRMARSGAGITHPTQSWISKDSIMKVLSNPEYERRAVAVSRLFKLYGGVERAATLLEAAAYGDLELMLLPTDASFSAWVRLGGYDLAVLWLVGSLVWMYCATSCMACCVRCCIGGHQPQQECKPKQS